MFRKYFVLLLIVISSLDLCCQVLKGKIIDAGNRQPVSFAVIAIGNSNNGTTADLDGNFSLTPGDEKTISIHVIGYLKKTIAVSELNLGIINIIKLQPGEISLQEIVVRPKENPAIPIIKKVIDNKPENDIANLKHYLCKTYAKTYFTLSDRNGEEDFYNADSVKFKKSKDMLEKTYLFFMESVTEKKYTYKGNMQEKVLSSRVSGFKSAPFSSFASQLQSFTFYGDNIELMGIKYVSPLTSGTFKRYEFDITDTVLWGSDTTILIRFYPKKNHSFNAMKGVLYISKSKYVLANVMAEPAEIKKDGTGIKVQQLYEKVDPLHWFPVQANTEILFYGVGVSPDKNTGDPKGIIMKGVSKLYVKDIKLDTVIRIKNKSVMAFNGDNFDKKDEKFWNTYRVDSLNAKEKRSYKLIDSIGSKAKFDQKLKWFVALTTGKWNLGYADIDLKHLVRFNDYESVRPGFGLSTSNKLSKWFCVSAYGGYGIKDKAFKYGGSARINLNDRQSTYVLVEAASEVIESAGTFFLGENAALISTENIRPLLISRMDKVNFAKASFNTSVRNSVKVSLYAQTQVRQSPFGYYRNYGNSLTSEQTNFIVNEAGLQLRYWPGEKFAESFGQLVSLGSKHPVFSLNISEGLLNKVDVYQGQFSYTKIDLRIDHKINFKVKGYISYQLQAGKVFGDVPYFLQYNNKGSRTDSYYISAEKTFETMYLNEFISTQYAALFFSINSGQLVKANKYCNPEIEVVHNYGIGTLQNREKLTNIELNDISKGYSEAGLRFKNLIKSGVSSFGAAVFYRYGNYAYETIEKNLTYKLVIGFVF
ncbi:MAG: carboxypeptidase-like regulatory domain-containing protein [Bacteroidetes bacterium]|nr:carboxypeptidase-like regulatory domain-containing protein [Bacteroidota bacterium]